MQEACYAVYTIRMDRKTNLQRIPNMEAFELFSEWVNRSIIKDDRAKALISSWMYNEDFKKILLATSYKEMDDNIKAARKDFKRLMKIAKSGVDVDTEEIFEIFANIVTISGWIAVKISTLTNIECSFNPDEDNIFSWFNIWVNDHCICPLEAGLMLVAFDVKGNLYNFVHILAGV